jgi:riboflavin kinase/FMN adenylyltransferase
MDVITSLPEPHEHGPSAVAIGVFDGVHVGHEYVLGRVRAVAEEQGLKPTVLTFQTHPALTVRPENAPQLLTSVDQKVERFEQCGIENAFVLPFDEEFAETTSTQFIEDLLIDRIGAKAVIVGADFHFGADRSGNVDSLIEAGEALGFTVEVLELEGLESGREPVSSTAIRRALAGGRVADAAAMLGRPYQIDGVVIEGDRRGRTIGFPTANIPVSMDRAWPADAVYAGYFTRASGERHECAINIGRRPTFYEHAEHSILEAHLLDFDGDLYGERARVEFIKFLRSEQRFDGIDALAEQLKLDIEKTRSVLAEHG